MEKTGVFLNGKFIECDLKNLEILIKGNVQKLNVDTNNQAVTIIKNHTTMNIGQVRQQNFYGSINHYSGNEEQMIENIPSIKINVVGDINNITANIGDVYCKNANIVETTAGSVQVNGDVSGSIKSMSGSITVTGKVGGNASSMSGSVVINK